jgi:hypothetical protein
MKFKSKAGSGSGSVGQMTDLRIQISTNMSRNRNTGCKGLITQHILMQGVVDVF